MRRVLGLVVAILGCVPASGCSGTRAHDDAAAFVVTDAEYARTFDAAKNVLRDAGFTLDRVDASRGVISTRPRTSSGLATPWIERSTTPGAGAAGVFHRERRVATVRFERAGPGDADPGSIVARVEVTVERLGAPGRKPEPSSIRLTTTWTGGAGSGAGQTPFTTMAERPDPALSARLAHQIEARAGAGAPDPPG